MKPWLPLLLTGLLTALAGCLVSPELPKNQAISLPPAFSEAPAGKKTSVVGRWWQRFHDPALDRLMAETFAANLDIAQAVARLAQAEAEARAAGAALSPTLTGSGQAGRNQQQLLAGATRSTNTSLSLAASYELDLWQRLRARSRAARLTALASRADLKTLYLTLSAQVADYYFLAREKKARLALAEQTVSVLADILSRLKRRYQAGLATAEELYQARADLAAARGKPPAFRGDLAAARHTLAVLAGKAPGDHPLPLPALLPPAPPAAMAGVPGQLLDHRPDIEAARLQLAARDAEVAAAIAERLPAITLTGAYGRSRTSFDTATSSGLFWNLLAELTAPIIDGGRRRAEVARSKAAFDQALARYRQVILTAVAEVEDGLAANRSAQEQLARVGEQVRVARRQLALSREQYQAGLSDYLPVLDARRRLLEIQSQQLASQRQLLASRITLFRALGGSWPEAELNRHRPATDHHKETP